MRPQLGGGRKYRRAIFFFLDHVTFICRSKYIHCYAYLCMTWLFFAMPTVGASKDLNLTMSKKYAVGSHRPSHICHIKFPLVIFIVQ